MAKKDCIVVVKAASEGQLLGWPSSSSRPISKDSLRSGLEERRAATRAGSESWVTFSRPWET